ncbi:MAG: single-stranded DNA-binding protein [Gemmatimonadetes bacterium]|nr:single-stranded DNA-binding protein [Gemmatimonadota bacterium]
MSRSLNKVILIGNLGADPEVRSTSNNRVATLSVATSRQWNGPGGERQEKTEWHRVVLWNSKVSQLADLAEKYLSKGDRVYIEGRVEYRTWEDREGNKRYTTEINCREMIMLGSRGDADADADADAPVSSGALQPAVAEPKGESYEDFPEALDEEDDDLPF